MLDMEWSGVKKHILRDARGIVLEIGAGTGETIKYYPSGDQIERIYGVEPSFKKCVILKYEAQKLGMKDKYEVVPSGIENVEGLKKYGIEARSIDTIVCVVPPPDYEERVDFRYIVCAVFRTHKRRLGESINFSNQADNSSYLNMLDRITGLVALFRWFTLDLRGVSCWMDVRWTGIRFDGFLLHPLRMEMSRGRPWSYDDPKPMDGGARCQEYMDD